MALLRRAWEAGIDFFDSGAATQAVASESLIARALPPGECEISIATTLTSSEAAPGIPPPPTSKVGPFAFPPTSLFRERPEGWPAELGQAVERSLHRLGRDRLEVAWFSPGDLRALRNPGLLDRMRVDRRVAAWGLRLESELPDAGRVEGLLHGGLRVFGLSFHLLNARESSPWVERAVGAGARVVVFDPHAGGLLNGERLRSPGGLLGTVGSSAPDPESLRSSWQSVARLGFLTREKRRTLGQAALQFVLGTPGVVSAIVPIHDPSRLTEWREALNRPALSDEERSQVLHSPRENPRQGEPRELRRA